MRRGDAVGKYIVPIVIVALLLIFLVLQAFGIMVAIDVFGSNVFVKLFVFLIFAAIVTTLIVVLVQRLKEIKEDDEDDLDKY